MTLKRLKYLIEPSIQLTKSEDRMKARLSAVVAVTFLSVEFLLILISDSINPIEFSVTVNFTAIFISLAAYVFSRTRYYSIGSWLLIAQSYGGIFLLAVTTNLPYQPIYFVIPLFLISLFSTQVITGLSSFATMFIIWLLRRQGIVESGEYIFTQLFVFITSVLIVVSSTVQRRIEQKLYERTHELARRDAWSRAVVEGSLDAFYLLEAVRDQQRQITDFRFINVNQRGANMMSMQPSDMIGHLLCELLPVNRTDGYFDRYVTVVETRRPLEEEFPFQHPQFKGGWMHHQVVPVGDGIAITTRDITERKNAEIQLRESESRHRALLSAIPDLIFVFDKDGVFLDYHAPDPGQLMLSPEQFMGKSIGQVFPPELSLSVLRAIHQLEQSNGIPVIDYQLPSPNGMMDFEARILAIDHHRFLTIVRDVTEHNQVAQQKIALELERERMELLSTFIRMASHEFRTPLAIISSSAYLMVKTEDEGQRKERSKRIEEQVSNLARLVNDLVLMSKLDTNAQINLQECDLTTFVTQIASKAEIMAEKKRHTVRFYGDQIPIKLCIDVSGLTTALTNIIENAVQFTPSNGEISVGVFRRDDRAMITISDNGMGIGDETMPHIFERFYRADKAGSTHGFGLGLSIAKRLIELQGGDITVTSKIGEGSTFTVSLPIALDNPQEDRARVTQTMTIPISA
jgi:PAS domain S-box-containing protein